MKNITYKIHYPHIGLTIAYRTSSYEMALDFARKQVLGDFTINF